MSDRGAAEYLANHPLLTEIFDGLERDQMERSIHAKPGDDETRRDAMHRINAVRDVRAELERRAAPPTNRKRGAVA